MCIRDSAGTLTLDGNAVSNDAVIAVADIGKLVFAPATANANGTGYATVTFQVKDDGGTDNSGQDTDQSANTITFDVTPVNTAPAGTDTTITILEGGSHTFSSSDFGFSDPDSDSFQSVIITTTASVGTLKLSGNVVQDEDVIAVADLGNLVFAPASATANGTDYATVTFQVKDDGLSLIHI